MPRTFVSVLSVIGEQAKKTQDVMNEKLFEAGLAFGARTVDRLPKNEPTLKLN